MPLSFPNIINKQINSQTSLINMQIKNEISSSIGDAILLSEGIYP